MYIKKVAILTISLLFVLGTITPVFAVGSTVVKEASEVQVIDVKKDTSEENEKKANVSKNEAVEIAKETLKTYFDYDIDEKKFESRIEFREDYGEVGEHSWLIDWHRYDENKSVSIDVRIDANNGKVKSIYKHEYNHTEDSPTIAKITREEAQAIADNFIKKVNPEEYKEVKLEEDTYPSYMWGTNYTFIYKRQINGLPFDGNLINIGIDAIKGEVTNYTYNWDDNLNYTPAEGAIDTEKAEEIIRENVGMELNYIPIRDNYNYYGEQIKDVKLVYSPEFENGYMLDAKEGVMIDYSGNDEEEKQVKDITDERKEEIFKNAKKIVNLDKEIDQNEANELAKRYIKELYGEGYEIDRLRYIENDNYWETNGKKAWSADFAKTDGFKMDDDGRIVIDALTKELISVYKYDNYEEEIEEGYTPVIKWEEGYDKAIEAIAKYFPNKINDIDTEAEYIKHTRYYNEKEMPEIEYYFNFQRKVNGIYYSNDRISVDLDTKEGKVRELRCSWDDDIEFSKVDGAITKETAEEIFFETYKPELVYSKVNKSNDYKNPDWEVKLVYRLPAYRNNNIDAFTGKFLDYNGQEVSDEEDEFKEIIKGHNAEKELSILAAQGIIDTKEFELDKEITRYEAIKMLVDAKEYSSYVLRQAEELKFSNVDEEDENYKYLQIAVIYGILENKEGKFKGDEKISREELAEMMVKLLGYDDIAKLSEIFKVNYKDAKKISDDKVGYVAICKELGIMEDDDGKFKPKDKVKITDMAIAIYNTLGDLEK